MKNFKRTIWFTLVALVVSMSSCKKIENELGLPSMQAKVDGETWKSLAVTSKFEDNRLYIGGTASPLNKATGQIVLIINGTSTGTYKLSAIGLDADCSIGYRKTNGVIETIFEDDQSDPDYYVAVDAMITITKIDDNGKATGTFSGTLVSTSGIINISEGNFSNVEI